MGKKLSELIRDSGSQSAGGEQNRWRTELAQVTFELIGVSTILFILVLEIWCGGLTVDCVHCFRCCGFSTFLTYARKSFYLSV